MQREQETVDVGYRFNESLFRTQVRNCGVNLSSSFFCPILQQVGADEQFANKIHPFLQKTILLLGPKASEGAFCSV